MDAAEVARVAASMVQPTASAPAGRHRQARPHATESRSGRAVPPSGPVLARDGRARSRSVPSGTVAAVAASIAVVACFGAGAALARGSNAPGGSHAGPAAGTAAPVDAGVGLVPVAPSRQFTASGQGSASTLSFHIDSRWSLEYQVECPGDTLATASFSVVTGRSTVAGIDTSVVGSASGSRAGLPPETVAVVVTVPASCSWGIRAAGRAG